MPGRSGGALSLSSFAFGIYGRCYNLWNLWQMLWNNPWQIPRFGTYGRKHKKALLGGNGRAVRFPTRKPRDSLHLRTVSITARPVLEGQVQAMKGFPAWDEDPLDLTDYTQVDMLGMRYKSVNFGAEKSPESPYWRTKTNCARARGPREAVAN